jgi:hypothetical protein
MSDISIINILPPRNVMNGRRMSWIASSRVMLGYLPKQQRNE